MDISFELYKIFYHVAKNNSFSKASAKLFISQSAVSQAIKTLEGKMNCQLFIRNTKNIRLTQEGEILFKHIEQAFNLIKTGERSINEIHALKKGEVRIGASDTICKYYLLEYIKKFNNLFPNVKIHIINRPSPRCVELLKKGEVDISVVNMLEDYYHYKDIKIKEVASIKDVFVAGKNFEHLKDKTLNLKELEDYPLIMLEKNSTTRKFIDTFLLSRGIKVSPEIELGSLELILDMAKIGLGVSLVVEEYIREELEKGEIFRLSFGQEFPTRKIGLLTNNNIPLPLSAQKFIALLD